LSASVEHYSTYFVIDLLKHLRNIADEIGEDKIQGGRTDIVFAIDTTGSMSGTITDVRDNIEAFVNWLEAEKIDVRLGLVEFRDIYEDGLDSTKNYGWYTSVAEFKKKISMLHADGGGDDPESAVDAIFSAADMEYRIGVDKYIILVTDADYKNGIVSNSNASMDDAISKVIEKKISVSVLTNTDYDWYDKLVSKTGGDKDNIYNDFEIVFGELVKKMKDNTSEGCWIKLSDGSIVHLDKNPDEGDYSVDTDNDGLPDLNELLYKETSVYYDTKLGRVSYTVWYFSSNPADEDTDGDSLTDSIDYSPRYYDIITIEENNDHILFNNGKEWKMYNYTAAEYITSNKMTTNEYIHVRDDIVGSNNAINYSLEELLYICIYNLYGCQIYMTQSKYKDSNDSLELFETLVDRKAKFFKHTGALWWSGYEEVDYGTEGGFWTGSVRTEADYNVNMEYLFADWDISTVFSFLVQIGAIVFAVIFAKEVLIPYIAKNLSALAYCIKTFGIYNGINFYLVFGAEAKPCSDGVIGLIENDLSDGDIDIVELVDIVKVDMSDGDSNLDDIFEAVVNSYEKTGEERTKLEQIIEMLKNGDKTSNGRNMIYQLNEDTKIIFRMDVGNYAHPIMSKGYTEAVNHINIEIQKLAISGSYKPKWDYHIILDEFGNIIDTFALGVWTK
jgi:hypothetical protein